MKTNSNLKGILIVGVLLACVGYLVRSGLGQGTTQEAVDPITGLPPRRPPPAKFGSITLTGGGTNWALGDLYEKAADWLEKKESAPLEVRTNVSATIYLQSTKALCLFSFTYARPFGKNMWMITMGIDGAVAGCFKAKVSEGMPPGMTTPPPPPDTYREPPGK